MWLFDLGRLDTVTRLERSFNWGVIVFVGLMVVCELCSQMLAEKKELMLSRPRTLSTQQFNKLVSALNRLPKGTIGLCSPRTRESEIFAQQFLDAFLKAGWQATMVVADLREAEIDSGILFLSYEGNTPPSHPDFVGIEQAFLAADISHKNTRLPLTQPYTNGVTTSDPVIMIGKRFEY